MINCIIVDDEQHAIDILKHYVEQSSQLNLVLATTKAIEAINLVQSRKIDLIFLDVQMPEISGIEVVHAINGKCKVIFTTAYENYAVQGYELEVVDFLLKPISLSRFLRAVQKVQDTLPKKNSDSAEPDFIYVKTGFKNQVEKIILSTIQYIESTKNYAIIHHEGKKTTVYISLKELEEQLPPAKFIRMHKSFIVAYAQIEAVSGNRVFLKNVEAPVIIGDSYKENFWQQINTRLIR